MAPESDDYRRAFDVMGERDRLVLYAIGSEGLPVRNPVFLQKILFLSCRAIPFLAAEFSFVPHKKGPYCKEIDEIVYDFTGSGLLRKGLVLTDKGQKVYDLVEPRAKDPVRGTIGFWKEFAQGISEDELLTFVYLRCPDMREESTEIERLNKNLEGNVMSLVGRGKISAECGSELLGMNYCDFEDSLRGRQIRWKS